MKEDMLIKVYNQIVAHVMSDVGDREYCITTFVKPAEECIDRYSVKVLCKGQVRKYIKEHALDMQYRGIKEVTTRALFAFVDDELDSSIGNVVGKITWSTGSPKGNVALSESPDLAALGLLLKSSHGQRFTGNAEEVYIVVATWDKRNVTTSSAMCINLAEYIEAQLVSI